MYKTVFDFNLYHTYFLDEGEKTFFQTNGSVRLPEEDRKALEREYKLKDFLNIVPTTSTIKKLKDHRLFIRDHSKGFRVLAETNEQIALEGGSEVSRYSPVIPLDDTLNLTFYLKVHDPYFYNYSNIVEKNTSQLYLLTNKDSSAINIFRATSKERKWKKFLINERETRALVYNLEIENQKQLLVPNLVSIDVIQQDELNTIETKIENAQSLTDTEQEVIDTLNAAIKVLKNRGIVGVLQLQAKGDDNTEFTENINVKNPNNQQFDLIKQCLPKVCPDFEVFMNNRETFWRYKELQTSTIMTTKRKKPLTKNGRVEIENQDVLPQPQGDYFFPNPTPEIIIKEAQKYYSEVFI
ncbi:hypothetical protein [Tenacibaculum xiamenense]|uniref:hypothetical protein n=1 Tax=Tenacibaculum xiamenense TaxID=1261553 RepID=UPI003894DFE5